MRAASALLGWFVCAGCVGAQVSAAPGPRTGDGARSAPASDASANGAAAKATAKTDIARLFPRWRASEPVRVRLSGFERSDELVVTRAAASHALANTRRAEPRVTVARAGELVRVDGGAPEREARLTPLESGGLRLGSRRIEGELVVRARKGGGLEVDALLDLERYVLGVLPGEISLWSATPAELEAQAIAARSYAVCALEERSLKSPTPYLFDDTRDQVFDGAPDLSTRGEAGLVDARVRAALERTRGRVLFEGERVVDARFCAACGGRTANARDLAPEADFACLRAVDCETCSREWTRTQDAGPDDVGWRASIDAAELAKAFGFDGPCTELTPIRDDGAGRWITVRARAARSGTGDATRELSFAELRAKLGPRLASPWIVACELAPDGRATFVGRGRGHGVGLCQRGARGLALEGFDAERILAHYFPGALVGALER